MIYIIDHQDSFTWNVVHQFSMFDEVYCSNYFEINHKKLNESETIVLSPGPGSPKSFRPTPRPPWARSRRKNRYADPPATGRSPFRYPG